MIDRVMGFGLGIGGWDVSGAIGMWLVKLIRMAIVRVAYAFARNFDASSSRLSAKKLTVLRWTAFRSLSPSGDPKVVPWERGLG